MERKDIEEKYKWRVQDLYPSDEAWEAALAEAEGKTDFSRFEGTLGAAESLAAFFSEQEKTEMALERLYVYALMRHDENQRDPKYTGYQAKAEALYAVLSASCSFCEPELTALPEEVLEGYLSEPELADYDYYIRTLIRRKKHVLSRGEEELLASAGPVYGQFQNIFSMIDNADLVFGEVDDGKGGKVPLTHGSYGVLLQNPDRAVRERAFRQYYARYIGLKNTIAATYYGNVLKDVFVTRARRYGSCLERALEGEDVDPAVYGNLLSSVHESLPSLHAYIALRKELLGLEEQHMYDIYVPLVAGVNAHYEYEEACGIVTEGLAPLGEDYVALLKRGFAEGWVDVRESEGKRSGAYSISSFGVHPYVLLNYHGTMSDVFTIAHEMGHSLHSYYSNAAQPYPKAQYRIFVAEIASTVNEMLLLKHLLATVRDRDMLRYMYNYMLDTIRTTLYRQTMFAEFEQKAHAAAERGEALTAESLSKEYLELNRQYYGDAIVHDPEIAYEWSRIPHFYTSFYVYKYSTGIVSALSIVNRILTEGEPAVRDYKNFLRSGGSDGPVELLKIAGVDLTKREAFDRALSEFSDALEKLKELS